MVYGLAMAYGCCRTRGSHTCNCFSYVQRAKAVHLNVNCVFYNYFLLIGYILGRQEKPWQVLDAAAVFALVFTPIIGFVVEIGYAEHKAALFQCGKAKAYTDGGLEDISNVIPLLNVIFWFAIFILTAIFLKIRNQ